MTESETPRRDLLVVTIGGPTTNVLTLGRALIALNGAIDEAARVGELPPTSTSLIGYRRSSHILDLLIQWAAANASGIAVNAAGTVIGGAILAAAGILFRGKPPKSVGALEAKIAERSLNDPAFASRFSALLDALTDDPDATTLKLGRSKDDVDAVVVERGYFRDASSALIKPFSAEQPISQELKDIHVALEGPGPQPGTWYVHWDVTPVRRERAFVKLPAKLIGDLQKGRYQRGDILVADLQVQRRRNRETGALWISRAEMIAYRRLQRK